jgi:hypothetical protein
VPRQNVCFQLQTFRLVICDVCACVCVCVCGSPLYDTGSFSEHAASKDVMMVNDELERIWEEAAAV